jgi:WD40-like Beta Propeller Repeat
VRWGLVCLAFACTHDQPMSVGSFTPGGPRGGVVPLQLTYNPGEDLGPVWLPDGSGFIYTMERLDRDDKDRCFVLMAAGGGSIEREICDRTPAADDSVDAYSAAAIAPDGRLAYVRATASLAAGWSVAPHDQQLVLGTFADPFPVRMLLPSIPYTAPGGQVHQGVAQVRWLDDTSLVYVGQQVSYPAVCMSCVLRDTLASGLEIVRLNLGSPTPVLHVLPGTAQASSVAVAGRDSLLFTVIADSRIFRLTLANDSVSVFHDFGSGNIARDVQVAGGRALAVVGGNINVTPDSTVGPIQRDSGGTLVLVDPATGTETPIAPLSQFRHPALSPDGHRIVAESYVGGFRTTDLWLLEVP